MKKSKILRLAKTHLWDGADAAREDEEVHICNAILFVMQRELGAYLPGDELRAWISDLMGDDEEGNPNRTLTAWLWTHHQEVFDHPYEDHGRRMQVTRHAWMAWMIRYWKARGE